MENELYSTEFKKFFETLTSNFADTKDINSIVTEALGKIASSLKIGKITVDVVIPVSVRVPHGKKERYNLFESSDGFENEYKEYQFLTADGGHLLYQVYAKKDKKLDEKDCETIEFIIGIVAYVTRYVRIAEHDAMTAFTDSLTGALNSSGIMRNGSLLFVRKDISEYTAVFFNIKNFSYFNQTEGTKLGDEILKKYSIAINAFIQSDELFARLGGDNFIAFIRKEHVDSFMDFISKMTIRANTKRGPKDFEIEVYSGLYFAVPKDAISNLMNYAAVACKYAKLSKKCDCVWFREYMIDDNLREKEISYKFHDAVSEEKFTVYYQPKVSLRDDKLGGAEALVRWASKERIIQPNEFIPVLEKEGTIKDLDFYMLKHVCQDMRNWLDIGLELVPVSVNFSKIHYYNDNLADKIYNVINEYGIDPGMIEIEITEMSGYDDFNALKNFIKSMKNKGIKTAVDDFGIGYSSINMLKDLDVDYVKFDKTFIDGIAAGKEENDIVISGLIDIVNKLNMKAVAEGVENNEQAQYLKKIGCDLVQGYLYDRPIEKDEFIERLKNKQY